MEATLDLRAEARAHMPALPAIPHLNDAARATWLGRMVNEYSSASVFEGLAKQVVAAGLPPERARECETFAAEERKHGVLCGAVVEALGGEARAEVPERHRFPMHAEVSPVEGLLRNLLSISCLSETVAVALIGAERQEMPEGPLRELLSRIWADEIGHARFGWALLAALLPDLDGAALARLGEYLAVAFDHVERHELEHLPLNGTPPPEGACYGLCSGRDARELFYATVHQVVIPRLESMGIPARHAWAKRRQSRCDRAA